MPTKKPRIMVNVDPRTHEAIVELAKLRNVSHARIVRELLEESTPLLEEVARALRLAETAPQRAMAHLAKVSGQAVTDLIQAGLELRPKRGRPPKRG
jgi:hypothetical protein